MNIQLDPETLKSIVSEAILAHLDEAKRGELIKAAIAHLITPQGDTSYGRTKTSPIQDAFNSAVGVVCHKVAIEMLNADETIRTKIQSLITDAVTKVTETDRERTVTKMADALVRGLAFDEHR